MKRVISALLAVIMLLSVYTADTTAYALTYAENKIESIQKLSGFVPGKTSIVTGNCYAFVSKVCEKLFGTEYQEELYNGYQCKHRTGKFYEVSLLKTGTGTDTASINKIINFFIQNAMPGDVVHYGSLSNSGSTHTFMIQSVDSKKMRIFHSNYATKQYGSSTCHIDTIYWDSFRKNPTTSVYNSNGTLYSHNSLFYNKMRYSGMGVTVNRYTKYSSLYYPVGAASTIPPNVSASRSSSSSIKLSWNNISGASKYQVQYKLNSASSYTNATKTCTATTFDVKNLTTGSKYDFRVRAYAQGKWNNYSSVLTAKVLPPAVGSATIKAADKGMSLTWPKKTDLTGVKIYKKTSSQSDYKLLKTLAGTANTYTDTAVKYGETYNYKIIRYVTKNSTTYNSPEKVFTKKYELKTPTMIYNRRSTSSVEVIVSTDGCQKELVYYVEQGGKTVIKQTSTKSTTINLSNLSLGAEYTIYCAEKTSIGQGSYGKIKFTVLPKDMENIVAYMDPEGVKVTFEAQSDVDGYKIYRSTKKDSGFGEIATLGKSALNYIDKNIKYNTSYYYQVKSFKASGGKTYYSYCFTPSNSVKHKLAVTSSLKVKRATPTAVKLTWKAVSCAKSYTVQYKIYGGKWITLDNVTKIKDYKISGLTLGSQYFFRVRAKNKFGNGSYISEVKLKVLPPTPATPTAKSVKKGIKIYYEPQSYATGYIVFRSTKKDSGYKQIATIANNTAKSYTDKTVVKGKTYYYKLVCYRTKSKKQYKSPKSKLVKQKY